MCHDVEPGMKLAHELAGVGGAGERKTGRNSIGCPQANGNPILGSRSSVTTVLPQQGLGKKFEHFPWTILTGMAKKMITHEL